MLQQFLDAVARTPRSWNALRWIAEAGYIEHHRAIRAALAPQTADDRRFLDFGCGTGQFAHDFPAERYIGFDLTRPYIDWAAANRRGAFSIMDGTAVALQPGTFDAGLVIGVFHHLPDDIARACVAELHRVLRPGARLLVIEDVPPPTRWNVPGHIMHWLDRGGNIRSAAAYRALWSPWFAVRRAYAMRSGICDYSVYVLDHVAGAA